MKKLFAAALAAAMILSLCACGNKPSGQSVSTFTARIDAADEAGLTVTPELSSAEHKSADSFAVSTPEGTQYTDADGNAIDRSYFTPGEKVNITYNGSIAETYPAQITAMTVSLLYSSVLVPQTTPSGDTVTITVNGSDKTLPADRTALKNFTLLVPSTGWLCAHSKGTDVGPLVIYPEDAEAAKSVTLKFSVQQLTDADGAKKLLSNSYDGLEWSPWEGSTLENAATAQSGDTVLYVAQSGENAVTIECTSAAGSEYAVILSQIANTLTAE